MLFAPIPDRDRTGGGCAADGSAGNFGDDIGVGVGTLIPSEAGAWGCGVAARGVLTLVRSSALVRSMTAATSARLGRPSGAFASMRTTRSSSSGETSASDDGRGAASIRCFATISIALSATNGGRPVSSSTGSAERIDVDARVDRVALRLLGRDVLRRPDHRAGRRALHAVLFARELRDAEFEHFTRGASPRISTRKICRA